MTVCSPQSSARSWLQPGLPRAQLRRTAVPRLPQLFMAIDSVGHAAEESWRGMRPWWGR